MPTRNPGIADRCSSEEKTSRCACGHSKLDLTPLIRAVRSFLPVEQDKEAMVDHLGFFNERMAVRRTVRSLPCISISPTGGVQKRIFDILLASLFLVTLSPLFLVAIVAIKLCDPGPVFYTHTRIGFLGRPFGCLKFRTMAIDADKRLAACLAADEKLAAEWATRRKLKVDPRLIRIGAALRRSSIDELPQLINILRGEMSLVGPRPIEAEELAYYGTSAELYLGARPGLTGAWQVGGRSDTSYKVRVQMDKNYCLNWSMLGDIVIIIKTIPAVFFARGSY
jgi:exopolysaccharide production protein ExoY